MKVSEATKTPCENAKSSKQQIKTSEQHETEIRIFKGKQKNEKKIEFNKNIQQRIPEVTLQNSYHNSQ